MKTTYVSRTLFGFLGLIGIVSTGSGQSVSLSLGSANGTAGGSVLLPLTLSASGGAQPASVQWTFQYGSDVTGVTVALGSSASAAQKSLTCTGNKCVVYGMNNTVIANGAVATATFQVAANPAASIPIQVTGTAAASPAAANLSATGVAGTITIPPPVPPVLTSLACAPSTLTKNLSSTCTASLDKAAPSGAVVSLGSNNAMLTVPGSVSIVAGQSSATFQATAGLLTTSQTATVTATWSGVSKTFNVTLSAPLPVPSVQSVTPNAGSGSSQTFSFVFSDTVSATNFTGAGILITDASQSFPNSCFVIYDKTSGTIQLEWDNLSGANSKAVASTTVLQNSQCGVGATTVVSSGLTTTITIAMTFQNSFSGLRNIYMYGVDNSGATNTGWVQAGTYNVNTAGAPVPSVISVTPNAASGTTQTFSFVFGDSQSATNLSGAAILIAPSLVFANSCMAIYDKNAGTIQLEWDSAAGAAVKQITSGTVLKNSQCNIGATSVVASGTTTTLTMNITFSGPFNGVKNIYMYGADIGGTVNTGWVQKGTYDVTTPATAVPSIGSATPNSGTGSSQTFSFVFGDSQSASNLSGAAVLITNTSQAFPNSCFVIYDKVAGTIQLEWDNVSGANVKTVNSGTVLSNSQCSVGATSVSASGVNTTITMNITFQAAFTGLKNIYMYAVDSGGAANTGWVQAGTYNVSNNLPTPTAVSVSPNAGAGASQNFTFTFSDTQSATNLTGASMLFGNSSVSLTNSCLVTYDRAAGTLQLAWDNTLGSDSKLIGSAAVLQNSQCSIGATSVVSSGVTTTITLAVTFQPAFSGSKNVYLSGVDNGGATATGWVQKGTWAPF